MPSSPGARAISTPKRSLQCARSTELRRTDSALAQPTSVPRSPVPLLGIEPPGKGIRPLSLEPGAWTAPAEAPGAEGAEEEGAIGRVATFAGASSLGLWILSLAGAAMAVGGEGGASFGGTGFGGAGCAWGVAGLGGVGVTTTVGAFGGVGFAWTGLGGAGVGFGTGGAGAGGGGVVSIFRGTIFGGTIGGGGISGAVMIWISMGGAGGGSGRAYFGAA